MKPAEIKTLRARWQSDEGRALALAAARWLAGATDRPAGLDLVDGRVDLRGLPLPDAARIGSFQAGRVRFESIAGMPEFVGVEWRDLDLSGATIRHARFQHASIDNCRFDRADLIDWRLWASEVRDSSFRGADLTGAALSAGEFEGRTNAWTAVDFDKANLTSAHFSEGSIHACTFRHAKLKKTAFSHLDLSGAVFEGLLDSARFEALTLRGSPQGTYYIRDVDFSQAIFRDAIIRGYRITGTPLPPGILHIPDFPRVVERAVELAVDESEVIRKWIERDRHLLDLTSTRCWDSTFFESDLIVLGSGEKAAAIRSVYERAIADTPPQPCPDDGSEAGAALTGGRRWPWSKRNA